MDNLIEDNQAISEELRRSWAAKGRRREEEAARKARVLAGLALIIIAVVVAFYVLTVR